MSKAFIKLAKNGRPRITEKQVTEQSRLILRDYLHWEVTRQKNTSLSPLITLSQIAPSHPVTDAKSAESPATDGVVPLEERDDVVGNLLKLEIEGCSDVSQKVIAMGRELELRYPHLFKGVACNLRLNLGSSNQLIAAFQTVSQELFRFGITWLRIVALFVVTKSLFVECAIEGSDQHSIHLVEAFQRVVRRRLAEWIVVNGGWIGLAYYVEKNQESGLIVWFYSLLGLFIGIASTWLIPWAWRTYTPVS